MVIINKLKEIKQKYKILNLQSLNLPFFKILYILSLIIFLFIYFLFFPKIMNSLIKYSSFIAIILITALSLRLILNEYKKDNKIKKIYLHTSVYVIIPLIIVFFTILIYKLLTI